VLSDDIRYNDETLLYMALSKRQKQPIIKENRQHEKDTGSAEVQIGLLTKRIEELASHLKKHSKDHHSRRGLLMMVGKRRRLLRYLERENKKQYEVLAKRFGIKV